MKALFACLCALALPVSRSVAVAADGGAFPPPAWQRVADAKEPHGMDFDVFVKLRTGMSEGELFLRAGSPDSNAVENSRGDIVKTLYYFPTQSNPFITTITLRGGRIVKIERDRKTF